MPNEIGIWAYAKVPMDFLSRYNAILRHYLYVVPSPLSNLQNFGSINIELMRKACSAIEGQNDFINFSKRGKSDVKTIRDMVLANLLIILYITKIKENSKKMTKEMYELVR